MTGYRYQVLRNFDEESVLSGATSKTANKPNSRWRLLILVLLLLSFATCIKMWTNEITFVGLVPMKTLIEATKLVPNLPPTSPPRRPHRRKKFSDYYFLKNASQFLDCSKFFQNDNRSISQYVTNGRMKLDKDRLLDLPMDCDSIKERVFRDTAPFKPLKRPIALVRSIFELYELQEVFLSSSYHPNITFCYVLDSKSSDKLKSSMRRMSQCFENIIVLDKEFSLNSGGHGQDSAHFECFKNILDKKWEHAIILQSSDVLIKSPEQLSDLSELLNYTSLMGFQYGFSGRYEKNADWTPAGLKLFKNEANVSNQILHTNLTVRKSLNEVIVSKVFITSILEKLNLERIIALFDNNTKYGVDEMLIQTLYENDLGLEGQMESNCKKTLYDTVTRMTYWDFVGVPCKSGKRRHNICIIGVEYLQDLSTSRFVSANKALTYFDFGTVLCVREMIKNKRAGPNPDDKYLSAFPQFREMRMKQNGTYNRQTFRC